MQTHACLHAMPQRAVSLFHNDLLAVHVYAILSLSLHVSYLSWPYDTALLQLIFTTALLEVHS